jgi:hypothetical protein
MLMAVSPEVWAERTFHEVEIDDVRRTRRLVRGAAAMMRRPGASLPEQLRSHKDLKALYRLMEQPAVTHEAVMGPHWEQTRQRAGKHGVVLLVQDTTEADYSKHRSTTGLGPIGNGRGRGFLLQTVLAIEPQSRQVFGIIHDEPFLRQAAPAGETSAQRRARPRESQAWVRAVEAVGAAPTGVRWVHVGDRGSDFFEFFTACRGTGTGFVVRAAQDRKVQIKREGEGEETDTAEVANYLVSVARQLPQEGPLRTITVPERKRQPAREARIAVGYAPVQILAPAAAGKQAPVEVVVVRAWEPQPPAQCEALEWILITNVPVLTVADAWERVAWYRCRWLVEDYHKCLKTGCGLERRQLQDADKLKRLLGILAPVAVRLLQLREMVRQNPQRLTTGALPEDVVQVVALLAGLRADQLTVGQFWRTVAQQGGYLGRRSDGPPGWQTLWKGWLHVQTLLEGIALAQRIARPC